MAMFKGVVGFNEPPISDGVAGELSSLNQSARHFAQ